MLEQIISMATQQLGQQFKENPNIPDGEFDVESVAKTAGSSIFEQLAGQVSGGNLGGLTEMLSGSQTSGSNPMVASIAQNVVNSLIQKNGLSPQLAQTISSVAVPFLMNMFNSKVSNAQAGGMDIGGLISGALGGGGNASGGGGLLGGLLGKFLGGGNNSNNQGGGDMGSQVIGSILGQLMK